MVPMSPPNDWGESLPLMEPQSAAHFIYHNPEDVVFFLFIRGGHWDSFVTSSSPSAVSKDWVAGFSGVPAELKSCGSLREGLQQLKMLALRPCRCPWHWAVWGTHDVVALSLVQLAWGVVHGAEESTCPCPSIWGCCPWFCLQRVLMNHF